MGAPMEEDGAIRSSKSDLEVDNVQAHFKGRTVSSFRRVHDEKSRADWVGCRLWAAQLTESRAYENSLGMFVFLNAVLIIYETDLRAEQDKSPSWLQSVNMGFLALYVIDIVVKMYVKRVQFFGLTMDTLDFIVVFADIIALALYSTVGDIPSFSVLRICRLVRLARALKVLVMARELHIMLLGFASAMRAMFWAGIMMLVILTMWSIVAVEVLHPINMRLVERGSYGDCDRCGRAFSTVLNSNLTFLQQLVAGDSWGQVSVPIIEEAPGTAVIFISIMITINLGLMNLVLTAIVDVAHGARESDDQQKLLDREHNFMGAKERLIDLCVELDLDSSGELTFDELRKGFYDNTEFSKTMAVMDVQERDMDGVFRLLDEDKSGTVSYFEFVEQLHRLKTQDMHATLVSIKGYINDVRTRLGDQMKVLQEDVRADCKKMIGAIQSFSPSGSIPREQNSATSLRVHIEGAVGLRSADSVGDTYCVCEVTGKPSSKVQTKAVTGSVEPRWVFTDSIADVAFDDSLTFSVWKRSLDTADALLGQAVVHSEQIIRSNGIFEGDVALDPKESGARLRVKVENIDVGKGATRFSSCAQDVTRSSLTCIADDVKRLSERVDDELSPLLRSMFNQFKEQSSQMPGQFSPAAWPAGARSVLAPPAPDDDAPPLRPERAGEIKHLPQRGSTNQV